MLTPDEKIDLLSLELGEFLVDMENQAELSIHGIRKRTKFIRALLKLKTDQPVILAEKMKLMSRLLAPYRDARVMLDTYLMLIESSQDDGETSFETELRQDPDLLRSLPEPLARETMHHLLFDFNLQLKVSRMDISKELIYQGIDESFDLVKKFFLLVQTSSESELVHSWRKKTKRLWYQLRFVYGDEAENGDQTLLTIDTLGNLLGEIHDLDMFSDRLANTDQEDLLTVAKVRREQLLKESLTQAAEFFNSFKTSFPKILL